MQVSRYLKKKNAANKRWNERYRNDRAFPDETVLLQSEISVTRKITVKAVRKRMLRRQLLRR